MTAETRRVSVAFTIHGYGEDDAVGLYAGMSNDDLAEVMRGLFVRKMRGEITSGGGVKVRASVTVRSIP